MVSCMAYLKTCFPGGAQTSNWVQFFELYLRCQGSPPCVDGPGSARDVGRAHAQNWGTLLLPADLTPCFPAAGGAPSLPPIFSWTNCIFPLLLHGPDCGQSSDTHLVYFSFSNTTPSRTCLLRHSPVPSGSCLLYLVLCS